CLWEPLSHPIINELSLVVVKPSEHFPDPTLRIAIRVPRNNHALFKLRLCTQPEFAQSLNHYGTSEENDSYLLYFESFDKHGMLLEHLRRSMGNRVDDFENTHQEPHGISPFRNDVFAKIIDGVQFRKLRLLRFEITDAIVNLTKKYVFPNLDHISLESTQMNISDPRQFLLEISKYVRDVHLEGLVLDLTEVDCAELIVEMFSNKMEKMAFLNLALPQAGLLIEKLPTLGKPIKFKSYCLIEDLDYTINNHRVTADGCYLRIKHI
ncbi:hypothetical protein PMAYCL1PPCAC_20298, partial [Pristionchus mayeri]